jgi:hypothetical protein
MASRVMMMLYISASESFRSRSALVVDSLTSCVRSQSVDARGSRSTGRSHFIEADGS